MVKSFLSKYVKFGIVGGIGYFESLALFYIFTRWFGIFDLYALTINLFVVSLTNFIGNVLIGNIKLESD